MKIELGKTKIRGFKFADKNQGCLFLDEMEDYIGKIGVITHLITTDLGEKIRVKFEGYACDYPYYLAEDYIVNENRFQVDWKDCVDLKEINTKPLAARTFPIPDKYTKEDLIPNFLIGGYTSPNQNEVNRKMSESCKRIAEEFNRIVTKHQNKNNMKNLKITAPDGYEIDKEKSTFENIVFKPLKKELPKSWDELVGISGGYVKSSTSAVYSSSVCPTTDANKNVFATKEQAEASLALAQLSQLREVYRDGWKPDWSDDKQHKYCIRFGLCGKELVKTFEYTYFLSFQSAEVRDLFLKNFRDLIEQAKPLMS